MYIQKCSERNEPNSPDVAMGSGGTGSKASDGDKNKTTTCATNTARVSRMI